MPDDASRPRTRPSLTPPGSRTATPGRPADPRQGTPARPADHRAADHRAADHRAAEQPKPPVTPEERERGRIVGLAALGGAAVVAVVVTVGIFLPALGAMFSGAPAPVDVSNLPATITVCSVEYTLVAATPESLDAARARAGAEPVVVGTRATCPDGVCVRNGACLDVVFLRTNDDRFVPYTVDDTSDTS
jgi:hypothetical protein